MHCVPREVGGPEMSAIWCRYVRSFIGKRRYNKLIAEKRVEDASEYIWLRLDARSVLIYKSKSVKLNCVPR